MAQYILHHQKIVSKLFKANPENFNIKILKIFSNKNDTLEYERQTIIENNAVESKNYFNKAIPSKRFSCAGIEKGTSQCRNIVLNKVERINTEEYSKNPLYTTIGIQNFYYIQFKGKKYIINNIKLLQKFCLEINATDSQIVRILKSNTPYIAKQKRFEHLNGLHGEILKYSEESLIFILDNIDYIYNPFDYDLYDIFDEMFVLKDWLKITKGKTRATIRSMKGYSHTEITKQKMRDNNGVKDKILFYKGDEIKYFYPYENIPEGYIQGYSPESLEKFSKAHKEQKFYHNPTTKECKRFKENEQPKNWIRGRVNFKNNIFNKINDKNYIQVLNVLNFEEKLMHINDYDYIHHKILVNGVNSKIEKYIMYYYDDMYLAKQELFKYIESKFKIPSKKFATIFRDKKISKSPRDKDIKKFKNIVESLDKMNIKTINLLDFKDRYIIINKRRENGRIIKSLR